MKKVFNSILFKLSILFFVMFIVILAICGVLLYWSQVEIYQDQIRTKSVQVANNLANLVAKEGYLFIEFQDFIVEQNVNFKMPIDHDGDYTKTEAAFFDHFNKRYPGRTFGTDLKFDEMDMELKNEYARHMYSKWYGIKEDAKNEFDLAYISYITPSEKPHHMYYVIDAVRDPSEKYGNKYQYVGMNVDEPLEKHPMMWEAWETGRPSSGYDVYDDSYQYGNTYAYYVPLYIGERKMGLIGVDFSIEKVNHNIMSHTILQMLNILVVVAVALVVILFIIYKFYIQRILRLKANVEKYAMDKDVRIASDIDRDSLGHDELSGLTGEVAAMILELEEYMKRLLRTTEELTDSRERAIAMHELANKDALTGIRNRNAYEEEVKKLQWEIDSKEASFALAVIDLNFLKRVNDTFGHDKGNISISNLCYIVCHIFEHSPVFRIGGDEFVVILKGEDLRKVDTLTEKFAQKLRSLQDDTSLEPWEKVSAAIGISHFDPSQDISVTQVFKRADEKMYEDKKRMKAVRE